MSLGTTWIGPCADGRYYSEPCWKSEEKEYGWDWFICLDEDDPPEIVVRESVDGPTLSWFKYKGLKGGGSRGCLEPGSALNFVKAKSAFGKFQQVPPPPIEYDRVVEDRNDCSPLYTFYSTEGLNAPC